MIRRKRIEKRLTQDELSKILKIDRSYLSKLENKSFNRPSVKLIKQICRILDIKSEDLFNFF